MLFVMLQYIRSHDRRSFFRMDEFKEINPNIYHLVSSSSELGGAVTLVTGKTNFLINCGSRDSSVTDVIVPALKNIGLAPKDIEYVVFTHCSEETIGGLHRLKRLAPDIRVLASEDQISRIKNPTYFIAELCSVFPDNSPPFREIRGVLVDARINPDDAIFKELRPIYPIKNRTERICWYHTESGTLICGDMVQGDGTSETGVAFFRDLKEYRGTLKYLSSIQISAMLVSHDYKDAPSVTYNRTPEGENGQDAVNECTKALEASLEHVKRYATLADEYVKLCKKKHEQPSVERFTLDYFSDKAMPSCIGYAMLTFNSLF